MWCHKAQLHQLPSLGGDFLDGPTPDVMRASFDHHTNHHTAEALNRFIFHSHKWTIENESC